MFTKAYHDHNGEGYQNRAYASEDGAKHVAAIFAQRFLQEARQPKLYFGGIYNCVNYDDTNPSSQRSWLWARHNILDTFQVDYRLRNVFARKGHHWPEVENDDEQLDGITTSKNDSSDDEIRGDTNT
jgi:hypothetical protein